MNGGTQGGCPSRLPCPGTHLVKSPLPSAAQGHAPPAPGAGYGEGRALLRFGFGVQAWGFPMGSEGRRLDWDQGGLYSFGLEV